VSVLQKPKLFVVLAVAAAGLYLAYQFWRWEVERIEVPPGKFLVVIHRWGKDLEPDQIVAPDDSYKGVQFEVRGPGRHFLNPLLYAHEVHDMVNVPTGKCLVLTRKFGPPIPSERIAAGDLVARGDYTDPDGERGVLKDPLQPATYMINPYAFEAQLVDAVVFTKEFVGVRTLKVGKDPRGLPAERRTSPYVVPEGGYRGVQKDIVSPGTYYVNPFVETITPVEVRSHKVEFRDIQFPSRDGFTLTPHIQVEYAVMKEKAAEVLVRVTDEGVLSQADATPQDIAKNEVLQKIILPHVRGFTRLKGSNYNAADFIITKSDKEKNNREKFRQDLFEAVKPLCAKMGIEVRAISLGDMGLPKELNDEISARDQALAEQETNRRLVERYKQEQALKGQLALAEQEGQKVQAQTRLKLAQIDADQLLGVEKQKLENALKVAETELAGARKKAEAIRETARSKADVITADNKAEVAALSKSVEGFGGPQGFAQYTIMAKVAPALAEIFASDGSDFGKLFSGFMLPEKDNGTPRKPTPAGPPPPPAMPPEE
jgi:regulator of protease activity HflC (stomatin/prohibitin superfamily)